MSSSGDVKDLDSFSVPVQASFSHEFIGSVSWPSIVAVRAYAFPANAPHTYSPWIAVVDLYPARAVIVDSASVSRDPSTGKLVYDVPASVSGASLSDGPCLASSTCALYLQTKSANGDVTTVTSVAVPMGTSFLKDFTGMTPSAQVVAVRVYTNPNYGQPITFSDWAPVTDPYPMRSVKIDSASIGRDAATGYLAYDVPTSVSGASLPDGPCFASPLCALHLQAISVTGDIITLSSITVPVQANFTKEFKSSTSSALIVAVRAYTSSPNQPNVYSNWYILHDPTKSESTGGGNKSAKGCTCTNGDPVNSQTGEFYDNQTDLALQGVGPAVAAGRTYSSLNAAVSGPFGYGWSGDFGSHLVIDTPGDSTDPLPRLVHIVQENGATVPFTESSGGLYPADPWVLATLTHDASSGQWTFTRDKKQVFVFDASGTLISTSDLHGNTVTYGYSSGHVISITGSGGREVDLTWSSGRVATMTDSASRSVSYVYNASGNLTSVDAADGSIWQYSYDSSHRLLTDTNPDGGVMTNVYNTTGQVTKQTDEVGRITTFAYSGQSTVVTLPDGSITTDTFNQGQLATITTATGTALAATTSYTYDESGNRASETDGLGKTTTFTYDSAGNMLTSTDPLNRTTTYTYNSLREVTSVTSPELKQSTSTYDSEGNLTSTTSPGGHEQQWAYNTNGTIDTSTDARGKVTDYTYSASGLPLCVTDPDSRQSCATYNSAGFTLTKTDNAADTTSYTVDDLGRMLTTTDPNSHTTTVTYDGDGNVLTSVDALSHTTSFVYDHADQLTSSTDPAGKVTSYTYAPRGGVATVTDPNGHVTTTTYDAQGRKSTVTDADSRATTVGYDLDGRPTSVTLPSSAVTSTAYDAAGQKTSTTDALGKITSYAYNNDGQLTSVTDPLSRMTSTTYTDDGLVDVVTYPDASTETYEYNADGAQTSFTNADGKATTYSYDNAGLPTSKTEPGGLTTSYTYDDAGRLDTVTDPASVVGTRHYDDAGQLIGLDYPGTSSSVSYTYNAVGQRATMTDSTGTSSYTYNSRGLMASETNGNGDTIGYGYDNAGLQTSITYPGSNTVAYAYDAANQMTSVTDWSSNETDFSWTADSQLSTQVTPDGTTETRTYDSRDALTQIQDVNSGSPFATYGYGFDDAGQLVSRTTTDALNAGTSDTFGYDPRGQLAATSSTTGYTTSSAGLVTGTPAGDSLSYNSKQELTAISNTTAGTSSTYSYDGAGNRTEADTTASGGSTETDYTYNYRNELTTATSPSYDIGYTSDGDGLRQSRTTSAGSDQFLWDTKEGIALLLNDGAHQFIYGPSLTPIAQIDRSGNVEYLHDDNLGSVRDITDSAGTLVSVADYNPYGERSAHSGTSDSSVGYTGNWTDPDTGLVYLRARDLDTSALQFLTIDPAIGQTHQAYTYAESSPLDSADPSGLCIGMDGTPRDRQCTSNDFFWAGLPDHLGDEFNVAQAGFDNGVTGGLAGEFGLTCSSYQSDNLYWAEYAIGAVVMNAATFGTGEAITQTVRAASGIVEAFILAAPSVSRTAAIVRDAAAGSGNFGLGSGTVAQAAKAGQEWVGSGYRTASDGTTLLSEDGLRQWRPPSYKPKLDKWQSNFQQRLVPRGPWDDNGHLDITDVP
jgi:RHS repeat-associated protein